MNNALDALLKWPLTPFVIAGACAAFFFVSNGGLKRSATIEEQTKKRQLPWLATMVFVMSLIVVLVVRFFADAPRSDATSKRAGKSGKTQKGGGGEAEGVYTWHPGKTIIGGQAVHNAYKGKAPF